MKALSRAARAYHCGDSIFCAVAVPASTQIRVLDWAPMNGLLSELVSVLALCRPVDSFIVLGAWNSKRPPEGGLAVLLGKQRTSWSGRGDSNARP